LNLKDDDFKFGRTKIFFRPGKFAEFDQIMKSDADNLKNLIEKVKKWLLCSRWRQIQWCSLSVIKLKNKIIYRQQCIVLIQRQIRRYEAITKYKPKISTLLRIKTLNEQLNELNSLSLQLKSNKEDASKTIRFLNDKIDKTIKDIKSSTIFSVKELNELYTHLYDNCQSEIQKVKTQLNKEVEEEKLRKIKEVIENIQKQKEEEEKRQLILEENHKRKMEIEERRRKAEEEEMKSKKEIELREKQKDELKKQQDEIESIKSKQLEQEKRDQDLAHRLAQTLKSNNEMELTSLPPPPTLHPTPNNNNNKDLSKLKYSELRDAINNSCDIELLTLYRDEFHRRIKAYHQWKNKNKKSKQSEDDDDGDRAPLSIMAALKDEQIKQKLGEMKSKTQNEQRFFRIQYSKPSDKMRSEKDYSNKLIPFVKSKKQGFWYVHFDGDYVARQMEIYDNKEPVLLSAGVDDLKMCELKLEDTGLTAIRGAEILESEFESLWIHNHFIQKKKIKK
jgi:myosin VI